MKTATMTIWNKDLDSFDVRMNLKMLLKKGIVQTERCTKNFNVISGEVVVLEAIFSKSFDDLANIFDGVNTESLRLLGLL